MPASVYRYAGAEMLVECVPNFSEGRDASKVEAIVDAIASVPGVLLLGRESDPDHNRSVVTFAGPPAAVAEGALRGIGKAVELIDMTHHTGVHPRIGAADVVPFIPIEDVTLEQCAQLARETAAEVWRRFRVPVYLYEAAARVPERVNLEYLRRGGLDFLRTQIESRPPDIGEAVLHPTAGAIVMGARKLLIAFNINLATSDVAVAQAIARGIRASSGGLANVKAIGLPIESRDFAQVSMNLTDFERTGLFEVYQAVQAEAVRLGTTIVGSELIGFIPQRALEDAAVKFLGLQDFHAGRVLERRIKEGLDR